MDTKQSSIRRAPTAQPSFTGFRRYGRRDLQAQIVVQDSDGWELPLETVNLSPTGMFVESQFLFEVGEEHTLFFRSPQDDSWFRIVARVVRVEQGEDDLRVEPPEELVPGMAYEFVGTDEHTWEHLCQLVTA